MKTNFTPDEFVKNLESLQAILDTLVRSENYQKLSNSLHYSNVDFTLIDAVQALELASDAYSDMYQAENLAPMDV